MVLKPWLVIQISFKNPRGKILFACWAATFAEASRSNQDKKHLGFHCFFFAYFTSEGAAYLK